jgi:ABC-type multidrug transport system fused ATPase/permease subunit
MLLPIYDLCHGFMMITQIDLTRIVLLIPFTEPLTPYDWRIAGYDALFLALALPLNWGIVFAFEFKVFDFLMCRGRGGAEAISDPVERRSSVVRDHMAPQDVDEDILEEANRVKDSDPAVMPVRAETVRKKFGNVVAVQNVSFGLEYGECFALLGVSGAGKTTTFKCLTGELYPSHGRLTINGHDVTTSAGFNRARKMIGYCP